MVQPTISNAAREHEEVLKVLERAKLLMEEMMKKEVFLPLGHVLSEMEMEILLITHSKIAMAIERLRLEPKASDLELKEFCISDMMLIRLRVRGIQTVMDMWRSDPLELSATLAPHKDTAGRHQWHMHFFIRPKE